MAQLAAAGQMFDVILGVPYKAGIFLAIGLVILYMATGGAHADIVTDAVQGAMMLFITALIIGAFIVGFGVDGFGPGAINAAMPAEMKWDVHLDPEVPTFSSWWALVLLVIAHLGFVSLPHLGNKFFALRSGTQLRSFVILSSVTGLAVGFMFLGGLLGRAMGIEVEKPDAIIPTMFKETLPAWGAALLAVTILAAIVSTADGLLMSISQIFANDLYRKTWVRLRGGDPNSPEVDGRALLVGRAGVVIAGLAATVAVIEPPKLLAILLWVGIGGIIGSLTGPLFVGLFWRGATALGALGSAVIAFAVYFAIHLGPQFGLYEGVFPFNKNPFASTGVALIVGVVLMFVLSPLGTPLPAEHLDRLHADESEDEWFRGHHSVHPGETEADTVRHASEAHGRDEHSPRAH
jgi:Na+/proline symporter